MKKKKIYVPFIIMILIVLAGLGYFQVPRYEKREATRTNIEMTIESHYDYEVRVNKETTLWSSGEVLEKGMPLYFYALEPDLTVQPALKMDNPGRGEVRVEIYLASKAKDGKAYWSKFIKNQHSGISLSRPVDLYPIEINVFELLALAQEIEEELEMKRGSRGNLELLISLQADMEGKTINHEISFILDSLGIIPPPDDELSAKKEIVTESAVNIMERRTLDDYLGCTYFWTYGGAVSVLFITALLSYKKEHKSEYKRYSKWVGKASITSEKEPDAYFLSLRELIDTAVELDKKVLYDSARKTYYILDGNNLLAHKKRD